MEYRILGKTGLNVSMMGLGGIPIQRIDAAGTRVLVDALVENGVNYIDTARGYSVSEEYLGHALDGLRNKFILATKSMARTKEAMAAGVVRGLVFEVKGYMRSLKEQKISFKTYITGGHAPYILNAMKQKDVVGEPHLVLIGLNCILSSL